MSGQSIDLRQSRYGTVSEISRFDLIGNGYAEEKSWRTNQWKWKIESGSSSSNGDFHNLSLQNQDSYIRREKASQDEISKLKEKVQRTVFDEDELNLGEIRYINTHVQDELLKIIEQKNKMENGECPRH